jgi:adenylate cyclase
MTLLLRHFDDREVERAFIRSERGARALAIRVLVVVAILTLVSYVVINPQHFAPSGALAYSEAAILLILLLGGLFLLSRTPLYLDRPWLDLPLFTAIFAAMAWLTATLNAEAAVTGFPPAVMAMVQVAILLIFASLAFAGKVEYFLAWSTGVALLFGAWLLRFGITPIAKLYTLGNFSTFLLFAIYFNWELDRRARSVFAANAELVAERSKTEELLYNVLPQEVAARLKAGEAVADAFSDVTVVFVDLVEFSKLAKRLSPGHLVKLLNAFFSAADRCAERYGVEKVKTIGDAYLAVVGGMASCGSSADCAIAFARDLIAELAELGEETGIELRIRVGIHSGPVVGGVIGSSRLAYDYWGDTMNIASRLQAAAPPNGIAVSEATYYQVRTFQAFEPPQTAVLKGIGETAIYVARLAG